MLDRVLREDEAPTLGESHTTPSFKDGTEGVEVRGYRIATIAMAAFVSAVLFCGWSAVAAMAQECPNEAIRQSQGVTGLPDCMALEMVSPPQKGGMYASTPMISEDGNRVLFTAKVALADTPGYLDPLRGDYYVASRGSAGWSTAPTSPPTDFGFAGTEVARPVVFSPDFSRWLSHQSTAGQKSVGITAWYEGDLAGSWRDRSGALVPPEQDESEALSATLQGLSDDWSRLFAWPGGSASFLPGDPEPTAGDGRNTYVIQTDAFGNPRISLLARDRTGKIWGGTCGTWIGGGEVSNQVGGRNQGAISADGTRAYFSTRPGQPQPLSGEPAAPLCDISASTNPIKIMRWEDAGSGVEITELIASECNRASPPCDLVDGNDYFEDASVDGGRVYFTTNRQLADSDVDVGSGCSNDLASSAGCDLYLFDASKPLGHRLVQVSAGEDLAGTHTTGAGADVVRGVVAISGDGTRAYFVAGGVLTDRPNPAGDDPTLGEPNLYCFDVDGGLSFIGTVAPSDGLAGGGFFGVGRRADSYRSAIAVPLLGRDIAGREVGGDGRILIFKSQASLTNDDTDGGYVDVFRFDAAEHSLTRVSKAIMSGSDNGPYDVIRGSGRGEPLNPIYTERWASEDGRSIVFVDSEPLTSGVAEGAAPFLWHVADGVPLGQARLMQLPASWTPTASESPTEREATISADGEEVAFVTDRPLVPTDGDSAEDVYVARSAGGYLTLKSDVDCGGATCQGPPSAIPGSVESASDSFVGRGNEHRTRSCRTGLVRRQGKCKKKRVKHRKHRVKHRKHRKGHGRHRGAK